MANSQKPTTINSIGNVKGNPTLPENGGYNTYVGARYVPVVYGEWNSKVSYEPLTIVSWNGNSYTSKTYVPVGIDIGNTTYWVKTADYNTQVEYYRQEVEQAKQDIDVSEARYKQDMQNQYNTFTSQTNTNFNNYKSEIDKKQSDYESKITGEFGTFKNEQTQRQQNYENNIDETIVTQVKTDTETWLESNITNPENTPLDASLSLENAAAQAKITGDKSHSAFLRFEDTGIDFYTFNNQRTVSGEGKYYTAAGRVASPEYFLLNEQVSIKMLNGYNIGYSTYTAKSENNFMSNSGWLTEAILPVGTLIRIVFRNSADDTSATLNLSECLENAIVTNLERSDKTKASFYLLNKLTGIDFNGFNDLYSIRGDGVYSPIIGRIANPNYITLKKQLSLKMTGGYNISYSTYSEENEESFIFNSGWLTDVIFPINTLIRITFRNSNDDHSRTITLSECLAHMEIDNLNVQDYIMSQIGDMGIIMSTLSNKITIDASGKVSNIYEDSGIRVASRAYCKASKDFYIRTTGNLVFEYHTYSDFDENTHIHDYGFNHEILVEQGTIFRVTFGFGDNIDETLDVETVINNFFTYTKMNYIQNPLSKDVSMILGNLVENRTINAIGNYAFFKDRCASREYYNIQHPLFLKTSDKSQIAVHLYNDENENVFDSGWVNEFLIPANNKFRVTFTNNDGQTTVDKVINSIINTNYIGFKAFNIARQINHRIKSINHRGYNTIAPENSLSAFTLSKIFGFAYVETDVIWTSDDIAVCCHDDNLTRLTGQKVTISNSTYDDIRDIKLTVTNSIFSDETIPTFEQFLTLIKKLGLKAYVEIKSNYSKEKVETLSQKVKNWGLRDDITFISFDINTLKDIVNYDNNFNIGLVIMGTDISQVDETLKSAKRFFIDCHYNDVDTVIASAETANLEVEVWSADDNTSFIDNLNPYVSGVTCNKALASTILENSILNNFKWNVQ